MVTATLPLRMKKMLVGSDQALKSDPDSIECPPQACFRFLKIIKHNQTFSENPAM